jgi:hypothetical protein
MIAPVKVQRLHANESGLSRFDTFEIEREMAQFAPPAQPFPVSASTPALRFVLLQLPAGWSGERHRSQPAKSSSVWPEAFVSPRV